MTDERICVICQKRPYMRAQACGPCRDRLPRTLADIADLHAQLVDPPADEPDVWTVKQRRMLPIPTTNPARLPRWIDGPWVDQPGYDPVAAVLPANAKPTDSAPRVTGSREAPVPANLDAIDLTLAPGPGVIHDPYRDQTGMIAVAAMLDQWARDWRDEMAFAQSLPVPTVPELARWLSDRVEWACDRHPAVDEFANEMGRLRAILRGVLGLTEPPAEFCDGIVCRKCDRYALYRENDYVECDHCGLLYSETEYREWVGLLAGAARRMAA